MNRRAQQSVEMSFGMLFSIFLIVVFFGAAIYAIVFFLDLTDSTGVGQFYEKLQKEIDNAWTSSMTEKNITIKLQNGVTDVCFVDHNAQITNNAKYSQISYIDPDTNLFLLPPGEAGDLDIKTIEHINITKITEKQNPKCFSPGTQITIKKGLYSKLVEIN